MKINTKKCTPIKGSPDSVMIHPNKFIEESTKLEPSSPDNYGEDVLGRKQKYLPTIIYTPVLTSKRLESSHHLLSHDDIEELNKKLESLFLSDGSSEISHDNADNEENKTEEIYLKTDQKDDKAKKSSPTNAPTNIESSEANPADIVNEPLLGRFYNMVFSYKSCTASKVQRSARLIT